MSEESEYYQDLIVQGYSEEKALEYTQKYFPEFTTELPEPAPPPSFAKNQPDNLPEMDSESPGLDVEEMLEDGKILLEIARDKVVENQKAVMIAGGIFLILMVSILAYQIPAKIGPVEGEWMKSDGERVSFTSKGTYNDDSNFDATWELEGDSLTITWVSSSSTIIQNAQIEMSDDENAIWLKWTQLVIDGEESEPPTQCITLLNTEVVNTLAQYDDVSSNYASEKPSWCTD